MMSLRQTAALFGDDDLPQELDDTDELEEALDDNPSSEDTGGDDRIDDPVRMYLMQMGEIPLLNRQEEMAVARRIERGRRHFRNCMVASDYILQGAIRLLQDIRDNRVRLDRTIEVSVVDVRRESTLAEGAHAEPADAAPSDAAEQARFHAGHQPAAADGSAPAGLAAAAESARRRCGWLKNWGSAPSDCNRCLEKLQQISQRMEAIRQQLAAPCRDEDDLARAATLRKELRHLMRIDAREPRHPPPPADADQRPGQAIRGGQTRPVGGKPPPGGLHRQTLSQPRPEFPRPDSGGKHGADAGGRQVRVQPRLQVLHLRHVVDSPGHHPGHCRPQPHDPRAHPHGRQHGPRAQRRPPTVPGTRRRADPGRNRRRRRTLDRRDRLRVADDPPTPFARPARGRARRQLFRRVPPGSPGGRSAAWR